MSKRMEKDAPAIPARSIDYIQIVNEMNDNAFDFCIEQLFPIFNYRVVQKEEIRRVDLKEKLMELESKIPPNTRSDLKGIRNYYLYNMRLFFDQYCTCESGSRAQRFKNRALNAMKSALSDTGTLEDIDDAFFVFISILYNLPEHTKDAKTRTITDVCFYASKKDAEWLKKLWETKELVPDGIVEKKGLLDKWLESDYEKRTAMKLFYINNIVFLSRALQYSGEFRQEAE